MSIARPKNVLQRGTLPLSSCFLCLGALAGGEYDSGFFCKLVWSHTNLGHIPVLIDPRGREALVPVESLPGNQRKLLGSPMDNPVGLFYSTALSPW